MGNQGHRAAGVMDDHAEEVQRLEACINDLVSLTALPVVWSGQHAAQVAGTLLDVVVRMLELEFAYLRLADDADGAPVELLSLSHRGESERTPAEVGRELLSALRTDSASPMRGVRNPVGNGEVSIARFPLGLAGENGVVVAASRRPEFPTKIESLVMTVAVHLAVTELQRSQVIAARERAESSERLREQLHAENVYLREELDTEHQWGETVGRSPALRQVISLVERVAPTGACVLIQGETGTGKELIARAVHRLSARKDEAFVKLNCAAIPTGLLESELFGHERGAFTGAIAKRLGRFEVAHRGTIFLDEVGEIPPELQTKLLRVLQEREFERLGSTKTMKVDVRLIAASNRDLARMVADRTFRADLFYRLNVFPIMVPPLRERAGDIPLLVRYFTKRHARRLGKPIIDITPEAMRALCRYAWPGNIRELENLIERSVILSQGAVLEVPLGELTTDSDPAIPASTLEGMAREHIVRVLNECRWVIAGPSGAATRLGMKRTSLQYKMQKLGIARPD